MILSDFLSRQKHDDSNTHDVIPISFHMHSVLFEKYYNLGLMHKYLVHTQSQTKSSGIKTTQGPWHKRKFKIQIYYQKAESIPTSLKGF